MKEAVNVLHMSNVIESIFHVQIANLTYLTFHYVRLILYTILILTSAWLVFRNERVKLALRSGSTIANEVYPRRGYC